MTRSLIDVPAVAKRLGTTQRHVRFLVERRAIPFVKVGRFLRFDPHELDAWLADNHEGPEPLAAGAHFERATRRAAAVPA